MNSSTEAKVSNPPGIVFQDTICETEFKIYRTHTRKGERLSPGYTLVYYSGRVRKRELSSNLEAQRSWSRGAPFKG